MIDFRNIFRRYVQHKPCILLLVDYRGWAYDNSAREIARELEKDYVFEIRYVHDSPQPKLNPARYDLIYVFFWGETYHRKFFFSPRRTIKEVSSHRWIDDPRFGPCSDAEMVDKYLGDAETVICTSERLQRTIAEYHPRCFHTPNGVNLDRFSRLAERDGSITIGWAGNINDPLKGINDIIKPACEGKFSLSLAPGGLGHHEMNAFYNSLDVLAVASRHEGEPLTLVESMAAGCFPVCTDVGIVPELIEHRVNGYIVSDRTSDSFRRAFEWCEAHLDHVRQAGKANAKRIRQQRSWTVCAEQFKAVFDETLAYVNRRP